jgi:hypothetical protein
MLCKFRIILHDLGRHYLSRANELHVNQRRLAHPISPLSGNSPLLGLTPNIEKRSIDRNHPHCVCVIIDVGQTMLNCCWSPDEAERSVDPCAIVSSGLKLAENHRSEIADWSSGQHPPNEHPTRRRMTYRAPALAVAIYEGWHN